MGISEPALWCIVELWEWFAVVSIFFSQCKEKHDGLVLIVLTYVPSTLVARRDEDIVLLQAFLEMSQPVL